MIGPIVYLTDPSWTGTEKPAPLGTLRAHVDVTHGYQLYRWVKATALIPANVAVQYADAVDGTGAKSAEQIPAIECAGFSQNAIASGSYGWVCCHGNCTVTTDEAVDAGDPVLSSGAAGLVDDVAVGGLEHAILGIYPVAIGSATTGTARISGLI